MDISQFNIKLNELKRSSIARRIANGAFWSLFGSVLSRALFLVAGITIAHILSKEEYGEFGIIRSTTNMFIILATMGLGITTSKYISEFRGSNPSKAGSVYYTTTLFSIVLALIISAVVFVSAPYIASESFNAPHLVTEIRCGIILLFFCTINAPQVGALLGLEEFKLLSFNTLVYGVFDFFFIVIGAYYWGVEGAICGLGLSYFVFWLINMRQSRKRMNVLGMSCLRNRLSREDFSFLWKFSFPAALSSMLVLPVFWYVKTLLVKANGFVEMASFDVADQWRIFILFIPDALSKIVLPILSNVNNEGNRLQYKRVLLANIILNMSVTLFLVLFVFFLGEHILHLYGTNFNDTTTLFFLSISTLFASIATVVGQAIASKSKMWHSFVFNLIWAIMLVLFSNQFISQNMGAIGLSLSFLLSYVFHAVFQSIYLYSIIRKEY